MAELPTFANASRPTWECMKMPELDEHMAWFIGVFWLNGYVDKPQRNRTRIVINIANLDHNETQCAIRQLFRFDSGLSPQIIPYHGIDTGGLRNAICCKSKPLCEYFVRYIKPSNGITVPDFITQSTVGNRRAFLMGLRVANGNGSTIVTSCKAEWVVPIQKLAQSCGLDAQLVPFGPDGASIKLSE